VNLVVALYLGMPKFCFQTGTMVSIVFIMGCWGCQNQKGLPMEALGSELSPSMMPPVPAWEQASFEFISAEVEGDSLRVVVQYGGGCGDHQFSLVESGPAMKSLPPKQPIALVHETTGDPCRALIEETRMLDLSSFRRSPHGTTVILLESLILPYSYD
jgi:hypothetical protein